MVATSGKTDRVICYIEFCCNLLRQVQVAQLGRVNVDNGAAEQAGHMVVAAGVGIEAGLCLRLLIFITTPIFSRVSRTR